MLCRTRTPRRRIDRRCELGREASKASALLTVGTKNRLAERTAFLCLPGKVLGRTSDSIQIPMPGRGFSAPGSTFDGYPNRSVVIPFLYSHRLSGEAKSLRI